jgi:hypothetical protein
VRVYTLLKRINDGWKEVTNFDAANVSAAKKMADDYAFANGIGTNDVAVEEIVGMPHVPACPPAAGPSAAGPPAAALLAAGPLAAGPLATGSLAAGSLAAGSLAAGSLAAGPLAAGSLAAGPLAAGPLAAGPLAAGPLVAGPQVAGPLAAGPLAAGPLAAGPLAAGPLAAGPLAAGPQSPLEKINKAYPVRNGKEIGIGRKIENKWIRAERWRSAIKVTDLQNAGKRGKEVDIFSLYDLDYIDGKQPTATNVYLFECSLPKLAYETAENWAKALVEDATLHHHRIEFQLKTERGVDVAPAGFEAVSIYEKHFRITADNKRFTISDLDDQNETKAISLDSYGKKNPKKFYEWALKNKNKFFGKTFHDVLHMIDKENIGYHTYCAMD